ncbi:hypothetical protein [Halobellus rubicundus]|uniref:ABC transporter permease n=1 Tax=Halobellus rubicundus TaxID=2996466 RepID=A0ABD5MD74_9EURY
MTLRRDARHGLRIARAEFRRSLRAYSRDWRRLVGLGVSVLFFGGYLLFSLPAAFVLGRTARSVEAIPFLGPAGTLLPLGLVGIATFRTLERIGSAEGEALLLTTVHPRAVVIGLIGAELGRLAAWFGVPIAALVIAFAVGLGTPVVLLTAALVAIPLLAWSAVWGYAVGLALLRVFRWLPTFRRVLKVLGVAALIAVVLGSQAVGQLLAEGSISVGGVLAAITVGPLTEYVALAALGTPLQRPPTLAAVAVFVGLVAAVPIGLAVATRQASALWFGDVPADGVTSQATGREGGLSVPRPFAAAKSGRIAWRHLVRAVRKPQEFSHLVMVVFFLGPIGTTAVQGSSGALGPLAAGVGVGLGAYLAGGTFGLNPLGDDRPQFPLLLLSGTDATTLVRGRLAAGVALGLPFALGLPAVGVALGLRPVRAVAFGALGAGSVLAAAAFALGLGAAYPIYEEREFWGTETVVPSTLVMLVYLAVVGIGTAIALIGTWFLLTGGLVPTPVFGVVAGIYLLFTAGVSYGSYRYAIRRYRNYHLE